MLSHFWLDLRSAMRMLRQARGFTSVAIVTLGFGLMLCITAFTVVNAYLLRTLPFPAAERLYNVRYAAPGQREPRNMEQLDWRGLDDVIEQPIAWDLDVFYLLGGAWPESAPGAWVTPGFVAGFGIQPAIGRGFAATDFETGRPNVALISHRLWRTRFHGDPAIVGRSFNAYVSDRPEEAEAFTVIGVMPADFWHVNPYTDVFAPLRAPTYPYFVRLRTGITPEVAAQRITAFVRNALGAGAPAGASADASGSTATALPADWHVELRSAHAGYVAQLEPLLMAVSGAAGLVLLIACANVAVLLLVRASRREKEIAVRLALGASRGRIARLLLTEGLVLGLASTAVGLFLSWFAMGWLAPAIEHQLGRRTPGGTSLLAIDRTVVFAAVGCGLLTIGLFMLAPLVASLRSRASLALPGTGARGATDGPGPRRARTLLIAFEVAASLALLTGSALMVSSAVRMLQVDFGLEMHDVVTSSVGLRQRAYPDRASRSEFFARLLPRLARVGGVQSVAAGDWWPLQPPRLRRVQATQVQATRAQAETQAGVMAVSADYFATLRIPLRAGREFTAQDRLGSEAVAVISETLARRLWPNASAVGQRLDVTPDQDDREEGQPSQPASLTIVGVVADVRQSHTDVDLADAYVPLLQRAGRFAFVYTRPPGAGVVSRIEPELRTAVGDIDREVAIGMPQLLQERLEQERSRPRFLASLLAGFAGFAGVLALVGVYGAIAYAVRQREREIAVRMAIGATRPAVVNLFLRQGVLVLATGLILGIAAALASGRLLESQLYGVRPGDPWLLAFTTAGFAACGLLAIWLPARRAAATDPAIALRSE